MSQPAPEETPSRAHGSVGDSPKQGAPLTKELKSKEEAVQHLFYKKGKAFKVFGREVTRLVRGFEYSIEKQS